MQAAVDVNDFPGDETGNRRGLIAGQMRDLLGFAEPADRDVPKQNLALRIVPPRWIVSGSCRNVIERTGFLMISVAPSSGKLKR